MQGLIVSTMPGNMLFIEPLILCIWNWTLPWERLIFQSVQVGCPSQHPGSDSRQRELEE